MGVLTLSAMTRRQFVLGRQGLYPGRRFRGYAEVCEAVRVLYQDRLVARADLKLEREAEALVVKGFWLEEHLILDDAFLLALTRGFQRFMQFVGAQELDGTMLSPDLVRKSVLAGCASAVPH